MMFSMQEELFDRVIPDWATILRELVRYIANKTHSVCDHIRMSAVCRSWQASLADRKLNFPACLLLAEEEDSDKRCIYNVSGDIFIELDLPEIRGRRCWGSPFGWLVTCGLDLQIQLFNPLSRVSLPLPSLLTFPDPGKRAYTNEDLFKSFLIKVILSSTPEKAGSNCIVLAIYSDMRLAFARVGDKAWSPIHHVCLADDAIFFKGRVYYCTYAGKIFVCKNIYSTPPKAEEFAPPPPATFYPGKYLFDFGGNLCLACREAVPYVEDKHGRFNHFVTVGFEIFKLDMHTRNWEKIFSLGNSSLFLGNCCTFVIDAADYRGCRPNCIYLTDEETVPDYRSRGSDMGIYNCQNLKDFDKFNMYFSYEVVELFPKSKDVQHLLYSSLSPPLWLIPSPR